MKKMVPALLLPMLLLLAACGPGGQESAPPEANTAAVAPQAVGLVVYTGAVEDGGYNALLWQGVTAAGERLAASYSNAGGDKSGAERINDMVDAGCGLIWASEPAAAADVLAAAGAHPDIAFALADTVLDDAPQNVAAISFRGWESAFVAGYAAGWLTETGKVGMLGGRDEDVITQCEYGYMAGVQYAARERGQEVEVFVIYAGTYQDEAAGQDLAQAMYRDSCDIIYQAAGQTGLGVIREAQAQGKYVIGSDEDQSPYGPDAVLMSLTKSLTQAAAELTSAYAQGQFPGGTSLSYGLAEGGVNVLLTELVPQELADRLGQLEQAIIRGDLQPPKDRPSYEEFINQQACGKMSA